MQTQPHILGFHLLSHLDKVSKLDSVDSASVALNMSSRDRNSIAAIVAGALVRADGVAVQVELARSLVASNAEADVVGEGLLDTAVATVVEVDSVLAERALAATLGVELNVDGAGLAGVEGAARGGGDARGGEGESHDASEELHDVG
jgi:hypothetical protein